MEYSNWGYSPASSSWHHQAGGNASSDCIVPWINVDNSYGMHNDHHSAAARPREEDAFPGKQSDDTMTHNINLLITMGADMKSSKPDGLGLVRYRAPDIESFIFDHDKGYRFDPTTGLHYDANSRFFINLELGMLLSWDPLSNTYRRTGDLATLHPTGKVLPWGASDTLHNLPFNQLNSTYKRAVEVNSKTYRIGEGTSRSRSDSPARQRYDSRTIRFGRTKRSRSRSASSDKRPRRWRSRTRSVERRGERQRERSKCRNTRKNYYRMSKGRSRSPRPHSKTERRSRSKSASSDKQLRARAVRQETRQTRSRSVESRGTKRYKSNSGDARKNYYQTSKGRSRSPRPHFKRERRSRSKSESSDKRLRARAVPQETWQTRSRSVESRGRKRYKSNSGDARKNYYQTSKGRSRSPRPHFKRERRSRSKSASSDKRLRAGAVPQGTRQTRSRSVESRGRKRYKCNSRDARKNDDQTSKGLSRSPRPHFKTERRSRSKSASSHKRLRARAIPQETRQTRSRSVESRGRKRHKSSSRDARNNYYQTSKGSSKPASLNKTILPTTNKNNTHHDGDLQSSSPSQNIERKRDVWNRLGPSIKREKSGSVGLKDPEKEIETSVARTVRLVSTYDTEKSRKKNCSRDSSLPMISVDDESVFSDDCPDIIHKDLFHDNKAPHNIEAKPSWKHLGSRDYSNFDSQPEDQTSKDEPAANQKMACIEIRKIRNPYFNDNDHNNMKHKSKNVAESCISKKKPKEEVVSDFERPKKRCSPTTGARRIDDCALWSNSNSTARQRGESEMVCSDKSRCGFFRSSRKSGNVANISVSGARNQSKTNIKEARRSRSREPRSNRSRESKRNGYSPFDSQMEDQQPIGEPASNRKTTPIIGGKITRNPRSDNEEYKTKPKLENAAKSHSYKKNPKEQFASDLERLKQSCSPKTRIRRIDICAPQSKSNPVGHEAGSNRVYAVGSRSRSSKSSERSRDGPRKRSVSRGRSQTRQYTNELKRHRTYNTGESQISDPRELRRRSRSRGPRRNYDWASQISYFRESRRRVHSRGRSRSRSRGRRSCSLVSRWNHNFDRDSPLSLSSSDDEFVSRVALVSRRSRSRETKMSYERELDKSIYWSPNRGKMKPLSSSIHKRNACSQMIQHDINHSRETMERINVLNLHDPPLKPEGERSVHIGRSSTNRAVSQDSASIFHESTILDTNAILESSVPEPTKKSPYNTPAVSVINNLSLACEVSVPREDSFNITPEDMVIDAPLSENGAPASYRNIPKEAPDVLVIDTPLVVNGAPEPTEKTPEETPTVVLIYKPLPKSEAHKPREETPEDVVIDRNDQLLPEHEALQPSLSQDSTSISHESTELNNKAMPENRTLEQREKTTAGFVVNNSTPACEDPVRREDPEGSPNVVIDKPLTEDRFPTPRAKTIEQASGIVDFDKPLATNEGKRDVQNEHDSSPRRKKSESRDDSPCSSPLVDIGKSHTNCINSQDSASISHDPTTLDTLPETNRAHKSTEKSPNKAPAVVVTNKPRPECEDPLQKEDNSEGTPKEVVFDKRLAADEKDEPTGKITEETHKLVLIHEPLPETSASKPREDLLEEAPEVVLIDEHEALESTGATPEGAPEVAVIEIDDEPTKENPEGAPEVAVIEIDDEAIEETPEVTIIDDGDVLGHLFTNDDCTQTNIVLLAPLPHHYHSKNASDDLKNQIGQPNDVLKVYISYESTSGSPCRFMVVSLKTVYAAKQWHDSLGGSIVLNGEDGSKVKAYFHFLKKGNWNCKHCKSFNFFMQSLCSKCYQAKGSEFSPVTISMEPTTWVGITRLKSSFSTAQSVTESLPSLHTFNILSVEMISEPGGLPLGLCVFEVESKEEGSRLHKFFLQQDRNVIYLVVNEKPKTPDEEYLSLLFDKSTPTNVILVAVIPLSEFPDIRLELSSIKTHLLMLMKEDDMRFKKITFHVDKNVGAPYSYVLITFADTKTAAHWLKSRRKTLNCSTAQNKSPSSDQTSPPKFKIYLHFSKDNWKCQGCPIRNFPLRSLCHCCFKHREPNKLGPISQSLTPSRWVAIPVLSSWSKEDECIVAEFRELLKEFILKRVEVIRDSECPLLPLACAIEMQGTSESLRLREYLTKQGRFSVFVVFHNEMDERAFTDLSNVPDVMIVEAPPPECIDLTNEANPAPTSEISSSPEAIIPDPEERPPESIHLTSEINLNQRTEEVDTSCSPESPESATPNVDQPATSVNPTSEADLSQYAAIICSPEIQPSASSDFTNGVTETTEPASETANCSPDLKQSGVISVSPVPHLGGNTQWRCAVAFLNYGADYESVQYCQGNLFGVSYNYCLVHFSSPASAKEWYNKCQGFIKITNKAFPNSKRNRPSKAYLHFSEKNWLCDCGKENRHIRSICFSCFKQKGEKLPIFIRSLTPTKYLAVKLFKKYSLTELAAIFPKSRCSMYDVMNIKLICDPKVQKDNFGIHVLETKFLEGAIALRNYYTTSLVVQSTSYVVLHDCTAGTIIDLGFSPAAFPETQNNGGNNSAVSDSPKPDYGAIIWTSLYGFHLDKPPNNVVMILLCLEYQELPVETRAQIQDSIKDAGVTSESISYCFKRDVGSPFSYCLISFDSPDTAKKWFDKCKDTFQIEICRPDDQKLPRSFQNCFSLKEKSDGTSHFIKSKLHYSQSNWICNCGTANFPLRTVCHACFKNKNKESGYSVSDATKFVGIKSTECLETVDISALYDIRGHGYKVSKINIGLDPAIPRDPFGILIFEMQSLNEGIKFRQFLSNMASCSKSGQKQNYDPIIKTLMKIVSNSSGITYLIPYQK